MRIKTEHGAGNEYILYGPNKNYDITGRHCDMCAVRFYSEKFGVSKSGLRYKWPETKQWLDAMDGKELSDNYSGGDFIHYSYTDVASVKRSVRFFLLPLAAVLLIFVLGVYMKLWWMSAASLLGIPFCMGECVRLKTKNGRSIKIPYCRFKHRDLVDIILNKFND